MAKVYKWFWRIAGTTAVLSVVFLALFITANRAGDIVLLRTTRETLLVSVTAACGYGTVIGLKSCVLLTCIIIWDAIYKATKKRFESTSQK